MKTFLKKILFLVPGSWLVVLNSFCQPTALERAFQSPPESAKPWVFWYWMKAAVSKEGITADLEAMKAAGIGGVYLVPIQGVANPPLVTPPVEVLTPEWWDMLKYAMKEADRTGIKIAMHSSDGFATAGGPWITPEFSMQKVVWTETHVTGGKSMHISLLKPKNYKDYYRDIAILAFPAPKNEISTKTVKPVITSSLADPDVSFLADENGKGSFKATEPCWIQYAFEKPFTCRSITIRTNGWNLQSHRLIIQVSDDGEHFHQVTRLVPPRHGWADNDADVTHSIAPVTARYFRFYYDKSGTEPASEDLNNGKWNPYLKLKYLGLSSAVKINQFEAKNGLLWRVGMPTTDAMVSEKECIPLNSIVDLTDRMSPDGELNWDVPAGHWTVLRLGYTSTGNMNETGGAGKGLECDKLNSEAVRFQFDKWYGEILRQMGPDLTSQVLKIFHVDSWECGSQNWSPVFRDEFKRRRGYDVLKYLPVMAGIPVQSIKASENFLYDIRKTISEMVTDNFYGTLSELAHKNHVLFSAESAAPVMMSDNLIIQKHVDIPMGEFWCQSPSHDKPNDIMDAASAAHIYGKPIVQAEGFTTVKMTWNEYPGMLKTLEDRNFALGINKLVHHVFVQNPWLDRKPGMTMSGVGLFFQRDQTWWKPGSVWIDYTRRCQALLQQGIYVADVAVFTGEEFPRRALLPDRFVKTLPGIFGQERVRSELLRLKNEGVPTRKVSEGLSLTTNMAEPQYWTDPLRGYAYDAINPDALLHLAKVENGRIVLPGGASYGVLVIPGKHPMNPDEKMISAEAMAKIFQLVKEGAMVIMETLPDHTPGDPLRLNDEDKRVSLLLKEIVDISPVKSGNLNIRSIGKGKLIEGVYENETFDAIGISRDIWAKDSTSNQSKGIAWTHRTSKDFDLYFISNQKNLSRILDLSLRISGKVPELWDAVTGERRNAESWEMANGRTRLSVKLDANASVFIVFQKTAEKGKSVGKNWIDTLQFLPVAGSWKVKFDPAFGGPSNLVTFEKLSDWSKNLLPGIKYYSGTAIYTTEVFLKKTPKGQLWLDLGKVSNLAEVKVNGISCGVAWTWPYRVDITNAIKQGKNVIEMDVTNTWANRLMGDHLLPESERITKTTAPYLMEGKPLNEAGLLGPVVICTIKMN